MKKLDEKSEVFAFLKKFFPTLSEAKVKAEVFVGPQIKINIADEEFLHLLNRAQEASWNSFKAVVSGFLGNNKAENYVRKSVGFGMSLKVHMLHAHLDKFKNNMGRVFKRARRTFPSRYYGLLPRLSRPIQ